jgi:SAM-dependent methyltransferase
MSFANCEKADYSIPRDERLLRPENIEAVRVRSEYLADWISEFYKARLSSGKRTPKVLSVGCGLGYDVVRLCRNGLDARGIEPVDRSEFWNTHLSALPDAHERYAIASDETNPFRESFDLVIAFEVLEHVGTVDHETQVGPDTRRRRVQFLNNLLDRTATGGHVLLACPNRLFPLDFSHAHKYVPGASRVFNRLKFSPTLPWSKRNFLISPAELRRMLDDTDQPCEVHFMAATSYFNFSRSRGKPWRKLPIWAFLSFVRLGKLWPSASPHLIALIRKLPDKAG